MCNLLPRVCASWLGHTVLFLLGVIVSRIPVKNLLRGGAKRFTFVATKFKCCVWKNIYGPIIKIDKSYKPGNRFSPSIVKESFEKSKKSLEKRAFY